jgi:hypothetical protein
MKCHLAEKKFSFDSPTLISYLCSFEMFRISLTVFQLLAGNLFDCYRDPLAAKIFSFESQTPTSY